MINIAGLKISSRVARLKNLLHSNFAAAKHNPEEQKILGNAFYQAFKNKDQTPSVLRRARILEIFAREMSISFFPDELISGSQRFMNIIISKEEAAEIERTENGM